MADPFQRLFWRAQIGILRACPPLCGIVSRLSLSPANSPRGWIKMLLRLTAQAPRAVLQHWGNQWHRRVVLSRVSVTLTTRCTLRCDKCIGHIPDLKIRRDVPIADLIHDMQALFACVDYIYTVILSGAEALLHPDLHELIRVCAASKKAGSICVLTNGTLIPDARTLAALRETKAIVKISNYGPAVQPNVEKLKDVLKENGIHYLHESGTSWRDVGAFGQLKGGSAKRRFSVCVQQLCLVTYYGKLHLCGESALVMEEGVIPYCQGDYIDLRAITPDEFRLQWRKLLKKRVIAACSYCLGNTYQSPKIPVAVQRKSDQGGLPQ